MAETIFHGTMTASLVTAEEFEKISIPGKQMELVRGRLVVREPPGTWHGVVSMELGIRLGNYVKRHELGLICAQDTGFKIGSHPDTVRGPDVSFIPREQVGAIRERGFAALSPALVAEILSPDDCPGETLAKVGDWLEGGTRLVWVIDPLKKTARVYRQDGSEATLRSEDALDGEDVVPGFTCQLRELLRL